MLSPAERRAAYYGQGGTQLAELAAGIGQPIPEATAEQWNGTLYRLALADDASEVAPERFTRQSALEILELDGSNQAVVTALDGLLAANRDSHAAPSIPAHFDARAREAARSIDLLRYQSPRSILTKGLLWQRLTRVATAGIYLDSLVDASEDSEQLEQFSSRQLALGAVVRLAKISTQIEPRTWWSMARVIRGNKELSGAIKGKMLSFVPTA